MSATIREPTGLTLDVYVSRYVDVKPIERHASQLAALGHVARVSLLREVVQAGDGGATTSELQERIGIPWTTLNHHLDRLVDAGLVTTRREGKSVIHTADYKALRTLTNFLWEDCCKRGQPSGPACC